MRSSRVWKEDKWNEMTGCLERICYPTEITLVLLAASHFLSPAACCFLFSACLFFFSCRCSSVLLLPCSSSELDLIPHEKKLAHVRSQQAAKRAIGPNLRATRCIFLGFLLVLNDLLPEVCDIVLGHIFGGSFGSLSFP